MLILKDQIVDQTMKPYQGCQSILQVKLRWAATELAVSLIGDVERMQVLIPQPRF